MDHRDAYSLYVFRWQNSQCALMQCSNDNTLVAHPLGQANLGKYPVYLFCGTRQVCQLSIVQLLIWVLEGWGPEQAWELCIAAMQ